MPAASIPQEDTDQHHLNNITSPPAKTTPPYSRELFAAARQTWPYHLGPCTIISEAQWQKSIEAIRAANVHKDFSLLRTATTQLPSGDLCREGRQTPRLNLLAMTSYHFTLAQLSRLLAEGLPPSPDLLLGAASDGVERLRFLVERGVPFSDPALQKELIARLITARNLEGLDYVVNLGVDIKDADGSQGWLAKAVRIGPTLLSPDIARKLILSGSRLTTAQFNLMTPTAQEELLAMARQSGQPLFAD